MKDLKLKNGLNISFNSNPISSFKRLKIKFFSLLNLNSSKIKYLNLLLIFCGLAFFVTCGTSTNNTPTPKTTTHKVTFDLNKPNGVTAIVTNPPSEQTVDDNATATEPTTLPTLTGYTFVGWYTEASTSSAFQFSTKITKATTLYAKWTVTPTFTVTYNINKPTTATADVTVVPNSAMIIKNQMATEPPSPALDGYTFAGWYSDQATTTAFEFTRTAITENITLYAKWTATPTFTVSYHGNKPSDAPEDATVTGVSTIPVTVNSGDRTSAPNDPTLANYNFVGWYTEEATTNQFNFSQVITANIDLYAKWSTLQTFTVTYNANKPTSATDNVMGVPTDVNVIINLATTEPSPEPTLVGYTFEGWYTEEAATNQFNFSQGITTNIDLYAKWSTLQTFTVSYHGNKPSDAPENATVTGVSTTPVTVNSGDRTLAPNDPTLANYNFVGWYTEEATTNQFNFSQVITANIDLYAKWSTLQTFTVTYNANKPTSATDNVMGVPTDVNVIINLATTEPSPEPTLVGYTFEGWYTEEAATNQFNFSQGITTNIDLYAKWSTLQTFTVTYNVNKPTTATAEVAGVPNLERVNNNQMATKPPAPALVGYTFAGWYSDQATTTVFEFTTAITENITLYAKWTATPTFTVTYNVNKPTTATAEVAGVPNLERVNNNQMATKPPSPALVGYTFAGWYSDQATTTVFEFTTAITENITLYAKWTATPTFTVTYNVNKPTTATAEVTGVPNLERVNNNQMATKPPAPALVGYIFAGWYSDQATTTVFEFTTAITENITLYAKWTATPTFTVTYNVNKPTTATAEVTGVPNLERVNNNQMATKPPSPALDGYTFAGWYSDQATTTVFEFTRTAIIENITLYAKWTAKPIFTVSYNVNKPTTATADVTVVPNSAMIIQNQMATKPPSPALDGYTFAGWYYDQATTTAFEFTRTAITENITLYAKWTAKPTVTVTYNANKPTSATDNVMGMPTDVKVIINLVTTEPSPEPTLVGYTFEGWYVEKATINQFNFSQYITANITLYAKWTAKPIFTVSYNVNKPTAATAEVTVVPNSAMIIQNQMATAPPSPALEGYTFDGWYYEQATTTAFEFTRTAITENITLYAKWTAKPTFTVSYNVNKPTAATADVTVVPNAAMIIQNQMATAPPSPALEGYTFDGWYYEQATTSAFEFTRTAITENITLYAKWTATPTFTVTYNVNKPTGATADVTVVPNSAMIIQNQMATAPPSPALEGYTFDGWYYEQATTTAFEFTRTAITENITLYAKWTALLTFTVTYNVNKPTTATADVTVVPNSAMIIQNQMATAPPSPALEGYTFDGWYYEQATTTAFEFTRTAITENITLYAKWVFRPETKLQLVDEINKAIAEKGNEVDLNYIDTSLIEDMFELFDHNTNFNGNISSWNVSLVKNMTRMFFKANAFNGDLSSWNVSLVKNMTRMFQAATVFNGNISSWNVSKVENMQNMFNDATAFNGNISSWNVSLVKNMFKMFNNATEFNGNISSWNVEKVTNMESMFEGAIMFNNNINPWNVEKVTNMKKMFTRASLFNQDLNNWNVSLVDNMESMFSRATVFNGNISSWNVHNVKDMGGMFSEALVFNGNISNWNVHNVKDMGGMFSEALVFNGNISNWNVHNVKDMGGMFQSASAFNGNISSWNVAKVNDMSFMFNGATAFNQDLSSWNVDAVTNFNLFRIRSGLSNENIPPRFRSN